MPGPIVVSTAMLTCSEGESPAALDVLPIARVFVGELPVAAIEDHIPLIEVATFGMCRSLTNPEVASATSAAEGKLTPMPCVPALAAPWIPGNPTVLVGGQPVVAETSMLMCTFAGEITVTQSGQEQVITG
ncbi:MAG TPA: DUF4280 domain-containing protein [Mycobacteriales bacterium]|nr:DUF4280 domain-containing protein [Mycobacteriales bacterium]